MKDPLNFLSTTTSATLYGSGIFTTVAVRTGEPFLWDKHWRRLCTNAKSVGVNLSNYPESSVVELLNEKISTDRIGNGRVRLSFLDATPSRIWNKESIGKTSLQIITGERRTVPDNFKLTLSPYPENSRSPLAGVKSCNYLEQIMSLDEAKERGFDEAVRLNESGDLTSACMANIFWLKAGRLYTPSLKTGCLAGTTREFVLENLACQEVEAGIEALNSADAIYLTSAGIGIVAVAEYDGRRLQNPANDITKLLS